jgi:hypothetical protein
MNFGKSLFLLLVGCFAFNGFAAMEFKEADITTVKNIVERNEGSGAVPAKVNDKLRENSKVSTAAASMAELTFADSSITRMGANTQFSFQSKERLVKLEQGTVLIHTPPGNGGATVDCGGVTGAVSGTTFMASRDVSGNTMFVLLEGQGGLKVTVGGSSTIIRPGQAASVGADAVQEAKSSAPSGEAGPGAAKPGSTAAAPGDDAKPGGTAGGTGSGPGSSAPASGGGDAGGTPPPSSTPRIQVFDVDVKRVVATTPLVVEFKTELPSAGKIEKTIEIQQKAVKEGKLEKLDVEVVAVKNKDGDLLVGAPRVEKEEMVVMNKKADVVGAGRGGADNLDIDTAAGPGAGGGPPADARPVAQVAPASPAGPAGPATPTTPILNVVSQVASGTTGTAPSPPTALSFSISPNGLARATLNRATATAAPISLSVPAMPGLTFFPASLGISAGSATTGDVAVRLVNPQSFFPGWDSAFNLLPISVQATAGSLTDLASTTALWPTTQIESANPVRALPFLPLMPSKALAALDAYFFFDQRAPGVTVGPVDFFSAASTPAVINLLNNPSPANLNINWSSADFLNRETFDFHAASLLEARSATAASLLFSQAKIFYGESVKLGGTTKTSFGSGRWTSVSGVPSVLNTWDEWVADPVTLAVSPTPVPGTAWRTWGDAAGLGNLTDASRLTLQPTGSAAPSLTLFSGSDGLAGAATADLQVSGLQLNAGQGQLELLSLGSARIEAAHFENLKRDMGMAAYPNWTWAPGDVDASSRASEQNASFKLEAVKEVIMGAASGSVGSIPQVAGVSPADPVAEEKQVRIEALDTSAGSGQPPAGSLAVIRSENNSLELRNVVIRGFAGAKLEGAAGRVLVSGTTMRDFKIKELSGLAINTDAKIQMAVLDTAGQLGGQMQVAGGLPVDKSSGTVVAGSSVGASELSVARGGSTRGKLVTALEKIQLDANEISLAADKIQIGADSLRTQVSAQNLITLRASTVVLQNSFMTVLQRNGMINVYVADPSSVYYASQTSAILAGKLNFMGANTFHIAGNNFHVVDTQSLADAVANGYIIPNASTPQVGAINVMQN